MGTLGTLASGLAHEISAPLTSIHDFVSLAPAKRAEDDGAFWHEGHARARGELERIRELVATMSALGQGRSDLGDPEPVDLEALAREVVALVQREAAAAGVSIGVSATGDIPKPTAVRNLLHQVLVNLVLNAVQVSPEGGEVRVRVSPDPDRPEQCVCVGVADSGPGIPEQALERVFDPFTAKDRESDPGNGLALMISHQIVADHGGVVEVQSREGEGTTFLVRLPLTPPVRRAAADA
jgi:signal transduction histidine kinase